MFRSYYGLSFNPFDKQMAREKDRFLSRDISEMLSRLDYLKDTRGIGLFTANVMNLRGKRYDRRLKMQNCG